MQTQFWQFLQWRQAGRSPLVIDTAAVTVCGGDLVAALLLTMLLDLRTQAGVLPPDAWRVEFPWDLWEARTTLSQQRGRRALVRLQALGLTFREVLRRQTPSHPHGWNVLVVGLHEAVLLTRLTAALPKA